MFKRIYLILYMFLSSFVFAAGKVPRKEPFEIAKTGFDQVQMIELFSSESCSSCPPADQFVSSLKNHDGLWKTFIPVVFHVDYWNYLNWKDPLSSDLMTKRQIELVDSWPQKSVYTPSFIVNGKEWKNWTEKKLPVASVASSYGLILREVADLEFQVDVIKGANKDHEKDQELIARMALLGFGLESDVTSGENSGRKLKHDFVVLDWSWKNVATGYSIKFKFEMPKQKFKKLAAVVWLEKTKNPTPLQVAGGYLK